MIIKIVSGGQTGPDRAALDIAIELNIPHGGWCPKGRLAELGGLIPHKYSLQETDSSDFSVRTKRNIEDSDGTLIFVPKLPLIVTDGTILTIQEVKEKNKPYLIFDLSNPPENNAVEQWIRCHDIKTLNVAGPRESQSPGIYSQTYIFLKTVITYSIRNSLAASDNEPDGSATSRPAARL